MTPSDRAPAKAEHESSRKHADDPLVEKAPVSDLSSIARQVLALQRTAGNSAVHRFLSRYAGTPDTRRAQRLGTELPRADAGTYDRLPGPAAARSAAQAISPGHTRQTSIVQRAAATPESTIQREAKGGAGQGVAAGATVNDTPAGATYSLVARTLREAAIKIRARPEAGSTSWKPKYTTTQDGSGTVTGVTITAGIVVTMPNWPGSAQLSSGDKGKWDSFIAALQRHEDGHVALAQKKLRDVATAMIGQSASAAAEAFKQAIDELQTESDAYDAGNDHGRNEGTVIDTDDPAPEKTSVDTQTVGPASEQATMGIVPGPDTPAAGPVAGDSAAAVPEQPAERLDRAVRRRNSTQAVEQPAAEAAHPVMGPEGGPLNDELSARIRSKQGTGAPLEDGTRAQMEGAFGASFAAVRVHADGEADSLNRHVSAEAFTVGSDLFFRRGAYQPASSAGRQLLAHELTHVVQQGGGSESGSLIVGPAGDAHEQEAEATSAAVARDIDGSGVAPAVPAGTHGAVARRALLDRVPDLIRRAPPAAAPPAPATGLKTAVHEGTMLTLDPAETRKALEARVTAKGWDDTYAWTTRFINMDMQHELQIQLSQGVDPQALKDLRRILNEQIDAMQKDKEAFVKLFETSSIGFTREILNNSEKQIKDQLSKLGIKEDTFLGIGTGSYTIDREKGAALQAVAKQLAVKRREADKAANAYFKARDEAHAVFSKDNAPTLAAALPQVFLSPELQKRVETTREEGLKQANEYDKLCQEKQKDNPVLAEYTATPDAAERLESLAASGLSGGANEKHPVLLADRIQHDAEDKLDNIKTVRGGLGGRFSVWKVPHMMDVTKRQMHVESWQSRVADEAAAKAQAKDEETKMVMAVVAIGLGLLAAIPTGGGSLVLGSIAAAAATGSMALSVYGAYESFENYSLESAAQSTDFDKAKAISQGDPPEIFWLALDIVSVIADVHQAATAFKTLKTLLQEARAAQSAEKLSELLEVARKSGLPVEMQSKIIAAAGNTSGKVATTLAEIKAVFKQARAGLVDAELATAFAKAADKAIADGKVVLLTGNELEQRKALMELVKNNARPGTRIGERTDVILAKMKTSNGLYARDLDIIVLKGERSPEAVAATLSHELTHQRQNLILGLEGMDTCEAEFQAFYAQQRFLMQLPVDQVPEEYKWLLQADQATIRKEVELMYAKGSNMKSETFKNLDDAASWILRQLKKA